MLLDRFSVGTYALDGRETRFGSVPRGQIFIFDIWVRSPTDQQSQLGNPINDRLSSIVIIQDLNLRFPSTDGNLHSRPSRHAFMRSTFSYMSKVDV